MAETLLSLGTNLAAMRGQKHLVRAQRGLATSMGRLASGNRINTASDDAAGLAISERLRAQVRGLAQAQRNANDGISMLQTAEGALNEVSEILIRMRELGVQSANGALGAGERGALHDEFSALRTEIDRIADATVFAGQTLIDGSLSGGLSLQVGITAAAADRVTVTIAAAGTVAIGVTAAASLTTMSSARATLSMLDGAINQVTSLRGRLGAAQNRLVSTVGSLVATQENIAAAHSRIRDADMATESASFARGQVLMQAGVAMLAQANQVPSMVLNLLRQ